jgi:hypothetical protein
MPPVSEQKSTAEFSPSYVSPTGELSARELKWSAWYLNHKLQLEHLGRNILIVWCVATVGYSAWQWGAYALFGSAEDQRLLTEQRAQFEHGRQVEDRFGARDVTVSFVQAFRSAPGRYDFAARVFNPNTDHIAFVTYRFTSSGGATGEQSAAILPGENRLVAVYGEEAEQFPSNVRFEVVAARFERIDPHQIADPRSFIDERLRFRADATIFSGDFVSFDAVNDSAYSYWQAALQVEFLSGEEVSGIAFLPLDRFRAGERRRIDLRLLGDTRNASAIRISPMINVFDPSMFLPPGA